ncbi:hypothetical protein AGMMS49546_08570 [Spirochaetia bacterium]|nr:hypothetical protein AGMMS49546_08570 [Spirochaetia bacterium]
MNSFKKLIPAALFLLVMGKLFAEIEVKSSSDLNLTASSLPEAKLGFNQHFTFPVLRGAGPLTEGNNLATTLTAEISPVSLNGAAEAVFTPIAFFQLVGGIKLGTGWNIELGGNPVYGMGINKPKQGSRTLALYGGDRTYEIKGDPFDGMVWGPRFGGVFQFDLAAVLPGDWHHVVFRTYHEWNYRGYTRAAGGESWVFEGDDMENRNGSNYYGNYLLGYQMPIFLNTVGLMAEMSQYLYNTPDGAYWGDNLGRWTFSALFNFTITKRLEAALIIQTRTRRNYRDGDTLNEGHYYYQYRELDRDNPQRLDFYRAAAIVTYKLR